MKVLAVASIFFIIFVVHNQMQKVDAETLSKDSTKKKGPKVTQVVRIYADLSYFTWESLSILSLFTYNGDFVLCHRPLFS